MLWTARIVLNSSTIEIIKIILESFNFEVMFLLFAFMTNILKYRWLHLFRS